MTDQNKLSRRDFIKEAAVVGGAAALTTLGATPALAQSQCPVPGVPAKWDYEADVVVVGFGGAGAAAAITAADAGAKVILLEKMPKGLEGGNTSASGGSVTSHQNVDQYVAYMKECQRGFDLPDEWVKPWAEELAKNKDWVAKMAPAYTYNPSTALEYPELPAAIVMKGKGAMEPPGGDYVSSNIKPPYARGMYLFTQLQARVKERAGIQVMSATPMKELVQNPATKEILGVIAEQEGKQIAIKAKRGVALCCGGFENNLRMRQNYLPCPDIPSGGTPGNTGDGIIAAMKVGADLWHMNYASCSSMYPKFPDQPPEAGPGPRLDSEGFSQNAVWVDKYAKRFAPVRRSRHGKTWLEVWWWDGEKEEFPRVPTYMIFDDTRRKKGSIFRYCWWVYHQSHVLSNDNTAEIAKGWITKGNTIEELAKAMGLDPATLKSTVEKYNAYCAAGDDPEFHQEKALLNPVKDPPFYGIRAWMGFSGTEGGPRRNPDGQILDAAGKAIPRLYAAGEMGSYMGWQYQGGTNVGEALSTGRVAGKNAAALKPWDAAA